MLINVRDILIEGVGHSRQYKIAGETPNLEQVKLVQPIEGDISISRLDSGLLVSGHVQTGVELECHRCLRTFDRPVKVGFKQLFQSSPGDDEFPIDNGSINVAPLIEQEIILSLPIKILCKPDCKGIETAADKYTKVDTTARLGDQARITKGTKRGRT
ncbi:MAG TPA: DUF177 domain-containing protein [Candidatus Saccharimonadia bacterium]|nr:DUF177 domain-containing protein [Candidatus Saccharimonadia bacterium]